MVRIAYVGSNAFNDYKTYSVKGVDLNGRAVDEFAKEVAELFDGWMVMEIGKITRGMASRWNYSS